MLCLLLLANVQGKETSEINNEDNAVEDVVHMATEKPEDGDNPSSQDPKWWEGESQFLLDSQQLAENLAICDEFLQSQSQTSCGGGDDETDKIKPRLAVYAQLPVEDLKKDLEECQRLDPSDGTNLELENASEFRLSQIVRFYCLMLKRPVFSPSCTLLNLCFTCRSFRRIALRRHGLVAR